VEYNYSSFDALAEAGVATIDATKDPERANAALAGIMDTGAAPAPPLPSASHCNLAVGYIPEPGEAATYKAKVR
jgi:hypothetical protein